MLKSKSSIEKWAIEVVRCEAVLSSSESSDLEKQQAEWKIEAIMELFSSDFDAIMMLVSVVEFLLSQ